MITTFYSPVLNSNAINPVSGIVARASAVSHVIANIVNASLVVMTTVMGLTIEKYFSMLIAVSVNRDDASNRMFIKPFSWHKLSPNIQSRVKHVIIENGIQSKATPRSAHAWFRMNMFVRVRKPGVRQIVTINVMLPNMASSMTIPRTGANTKYSTPGSSTAFSSSSFNGEEFRVRLKFEYAIVVPVDIERELVSSHFTPA